MLFCYSLQAWCRGDAWWWKRVWRLVQDFFEPVIVYIYSCILRWMDGNPNHRTFDRHNTLNDLVEWLNQLNSLVFPGADGCRTDQEQGLTWEKSPHVLSETQLEARHCIVGRLFIRVVTWCLCEKCEWTGIDVNESYWNDTNPYKSDTNPKKFTEIIRIIRYSYYG